MVGGPAKKQSVNRRETPEPQARGQKAPEAALERRRESARYIADLALELSNLARKSDLAFLSYLLDLASEEASAQARRS